MTPPSAASHPFLPLPIRAAYDGSSILSVIAAMLILVMVPTTLAALLDDRLFNGINIWIKPLKFQASLALHLVTIAWALLGLRLATSHGKRHAVWAHTTTCQAHGARPCTE